MIIPTASIRVGWGSFSIVILSMTGFFAACQANQLPFAGGGDSLNVIVSIPPQAYMVDRIGGDAVTVETRVPASAEPHTYELRPDQLRAISDADAYFRIRIDFEDVWMERFVAVNPQMQIVDTT